ncbi:HNH endonuclease family protein [Prescottella equi]
MFRHAHRTAVFAAAVTAAVALVTGCTSGIDITNAASSLAPAPAASSTTLPYEVDVPATSALLETLPVKGRAPKTGYSRDQFGPAWADDVDVDYGRNSCRTREDILQRDLSNTVFKDDGKLCTVQSGTLVNDPYTGKTINFVRGKDTSSAIQIEHVVALSDAWQKGAQQLTDRERRNLANDPLNLIAVDGPTNMAKGDGDAATWLPPNKPYRCAYVATQTQVKAKYALWVTQAEKDAIARVLSTCAPAPTGS